MATPWSDREIELTANCFKAVAQPIRLGIVCLLAHGELTVGEICEAMGTSQPNITHHLIVLHNQELLKSRKEANRVYYSIAQQRLTNIICMLQQIYCSEDKA
jgi:ArsR family transcriptional regulator